MDWTLIFSVWPAENVVAVHWTGIKAKLVEAVSAICRSVARVCW